MKNCVFFLTRILHYFDLLIALVELELKLACWLPCMVSIWTVTMCSYEQIFNNKNHCVLFYQCSCKSALLFLLHQTRVLWNAIVLYIYWWSIYYSQLNDAQKHLFSVIMTFIMQCKATFKNSDKGPQPCYVHWTGRAGMGKSFLINSLTEYVKISVRHQGQKFTDLS